MIDGGLSRAARPAGRQIAYRDEPARQYPDEYPRAEAPAESRPKQRRAESEAAPEVARQPRNLSWLKWPLFALITVIVAASVWYFMPHQGASVASAIDTNKYQAVFLSNGQVYFGRLSVVNSDYMKLTNVFYLERQLSTGGTTTESDNESATVTPGDNNFQLLKYSDVLYGSEDAMVISKDDIIRFENLRSDGVVAKAIANRS